MAFFPREHNPPDSLRRQAAVHAGYFDNAVSARAFLKAYPRPDGFEIDPNLSQQYLIPEGSPSERKARADEIAAGLGGAAEWHNGYYMARVDSLKIDVKIYFYPPIFRADVGGEDAGEAA
jgi:hypothetical protein